MTNRQTSFRAACFLASRAAALTIVLGAGTGAVRAVEAAAAPPAVSDPIGLIGPERLGESDLVKADQAAFDRLRRDYETEQHQLDFKYAKARYDLLTQQLDDRLDAAALAQEAKARGVTPQAILAQLKTAAPTEEEVRAFYEQNQDRIREPYDQIAPKIRDYLAGERTQSAKREFYDALRAKHGIKSLLGPYRVAVAATGPARGPASAPVTIVEFGDFQCPYCKRAESSLHTVLAEYPDKIRLVFRNLPLTEIHPHAEAAAEAAVCAERQGKFWEMHDAMYADQSALAPEALKDTAKRLGLDVGAFSACLGGGAPTAALEADVKAARALGLSGTPYFFINGRPVDGNVPLEKFQSIIAEELKAATADRG